jgi:hypothetical protein
VTLHGPEAGGLDQTAAQVVTEHTQRDLLQRPGRGADLGEDIDAVPILGDHPGDTRTWPSTLCSPAKPTAIPMPTKPRVGI